MKQKGDNGVHMIRFCRRWDIVWGQQTHALDEDVSEEHTSQWNFFFIFVFGSFVQPSIESVANKNISALPSGPIDMDQRNNMGRSVNCLIGFGGAFRVCIRRELKRTGAGANC